MWHAFDRETGERVPHYQLKNYRSSLADYHIHPETKFHNGYYHDVGVTGRRHILATAIEHIGKEASWAERRSNIGDFPDDETDYGDDPEVARKEQERIKRERRNKIKRDAYDQAHYRYDDVPVVPPLAFRMGPSCWEAIDNIGRFSRFSGIDVDNLRKVIGGKRNLTKEIEYRCDTALQRLFQQGGYDECDYLQRLEQSLRYLPSGCIDYLSEQIRRRNQPG